VNLRPEAVRAAEAASDIACEGLSFSYDEGATTIAALRAVDLRLPAGASIALLGPTGSGKSTLLQLLRGLLVPDAGHVLLDGLAAGQPGHEERERRIGLVFQMPEMQLFAATCHDDVAFGPRQLGWSEAEVDAAATRALAAGGGAGPPTALARAIRTRCRAASSVAWRWPGCWPCAPACCCWTSRS
jgi:energy-coupling factor transporter ATP-binding protein EcfA2